MNTTLSTPPPTAVAGAPVCSRPSFFRRFVMAALAPLQRGRLVLELPDGSRAQFGTAEGTHSETLPHDIPALATIRVRREAFFQKCFWSGDIGLGEAYMDGDWDTPDLRAVVAFFILNLRDTPTLSGSARRTLFNLGRLFNRLHHAVRPNTRRIARRNIRDHYDLSNEFFSLWLDPSMMYSAAKWPTHARHLSLADAQREKNDALCQLLRLEPTDHVLEIGTGWGGWCIHAAKNYGCRVTSVTISAQQYEEARRRITAAHLEDRIDVQLCDFRDVRGQFDKIVSIEMVEALGHRYQPVFAEAVARLLKPEGLLALQFITCPDARYGEFRRGVDFIQKHVFPGSLLLSPNRLNDLLSRAGGFVLNHFDEFGTDYARTLALWRDAFVAKHDAIRRLGFDDRFLRKWTYYLAYCEAAFALRNISVVHTLHARPNNLKLR